MATHIVFHSSSSGDFIKRLLQFVNQNEDSLRNGKVTLHLTPAAIAFLNELFHDITKDFPPPSMKGFASRDELLDLKFNIQQIFSLKIESAAPNYIEKRQEINLSLFASLQSLEIWRCKAYLLTDINDFCTRLTTLKYHDCLNAVGEALEVSNIEKPWETLEYLYLNNNTIPALDATMYHLKNVKKIDFSHNIISKIDHFQFCYKLSILNLSHNRIQSTVNIYEYLGNLKQLNLSNNKLVSTEGLEKLFAIESLDLSENNIASLDEVTRLQSLPFLMHLWFQGNPVCEQKNYRKTIYSSFQLELNLDGKPPSKSEQAKFKQNEKDSEEIAPVITAPPSPGIRLKKKKHKPRLVTIEEKRRSVDEYNIQNNNESQVQKDKDFQALVEKIHQENGASWLVVLHEAQQETALQKSKDKSEKIKKRQTNKITESTKEALNSMLANHPQVSNAKVSTAQTPQDPKPEQKQDPKPQIPIQNNPQQVKATEPPKETKIIETPKETKTTETPKETKTTETPKETKTIEVPKEQPIVPVPISENKKQQPVETKKEETKLEPIPAKVPEKKTESQKIDIPISRSPNKLATTPTRLSTTPSSKTISDLHFEEESTTEEFYVETKNENNEMEERIIIISGTELTEADVITGINMLKQQLKYLIRIEEVTNKLDSAWKNPLSKPIIQIEFQTSLKDRTQHFLCTYLLENEEAKVQLINLLDPIDRKIKCMNCNAVYGITEFSMLQCPRCKSAFIIELESSNTPNTVPEERPASTNVTTPTPAPESKSKEEKLDVEIDMNMQVFLRLQVFKGGASELQTGLFLTNFARFDKGEEEREAYLLITNMRFYILVQQRKATDKDNGLGLIAEHKLSDLKKVLFGLFLQYIRFEINENTAYIFMTRHHMLTHKISEVLTSSVNSCSEIVSPPIPYNKNKECIQNLSIIFGSVHKINLMFFCMLHMKQKSKGAPTKVPRSFVITSECIYLVEEDFMKFPSLGFDGAKIHISPQYILRESHNINEVVGITLDDANGVQISFEEESSGKSGQQLVWDLVVNAELERKKMVQILSSKWKELFKVALQVTYVKS